MIYKEIDITKWENGLDFGTFSEAYLQKIIDQKTAEGIVFVREEDAKDILKLKQHGLAVDQISDTVDLDIETVERVIAGKWEKSIYLDIMESSNHRTYYQSCWKEFTEVREEFRTSFNKAVITKFMGKPSDFLYEKIMAVWSDMCTYQYDDSTPAERLKERIDQMDNIVEIIFAWHFDYKAAIREQKMSVPEWYDTLSNLPIVNIEKGRVE